MNVLGQKWKTYTRKDKTMDDFTYEDFLSKKSIIPPMTGISEDVHLHDDLFDFQRDIVKWALMRGRAAIFAGTGLGKSFMEMSWGKSVADYTGKPVLLLTPLAVSAQMIREGKKFGITINQVSSQLDVTSWGNVTNYQKIEHFDMSKFGGIILDESSILKHQKGQYRTMLIEMCKNIPFRLAATATPAPNDFMELGNHSEFLGIMSYTDMLATYFVHDGGSTQNWRLRGYAEDAFWKWMCSWSIMLRNPRDLGYNGDAYDLPELISHEHIVNAEYKPSLETGFLFPMEAQTLSERLNVKRDSIEERVAKAAEITHEDKPFVWWCNLNAESDELVKRIPGAVDVRGSDKEIDKERKLNDFSNGKIRVLVTKPKIAGFGMNWQHCSDTGFVGLNDSFEQIYQAIRRFWRFGQKKVVNVHYISSELEGAVVSNIKRKERDAERMANNMVSHMSDITSNEINGAVRDTMDYAPIIKMSLPSFMK